MQWWIIWYNTEVMDPNDKDTYKIISGTEATAEKDASEAISGGYAGPYSSQAAATSAAKAGTGSKTQNSNPLASQNLGSLPGVGSIDDVINFLKQGSIWERAGEVLVGVIILYVAMKALVTPQSAGNVAKQGVRKTLKHAATAVALAPK
jgi:aconitase B